MKKKKIFLLDFLSLYPNFPITILSCEGKDKVPSFSENGLTHIEIMVRSMMEQCNREGETLESSEFCPKYFIKIVKTYKEKLLLVTIACEYISMSFSP